MFTKQYSFFTNKYPLYPLNFKGIFINMFLVRKKLSIFNYLVPLYNMFVNVIKSYKPLISDI